MKRGAKRPALSDSDPNRADFNPLRSKRVMEAPSFVHRAESSRQQQVMAGAPPLNVKRAESARQHVRALNTQFASWVQLQLQNHPDELWEDGVKDYLSHTSHLLEKFKDVVDWLRSEAGKSEAATTTALSNDHNNKSLAASGTSEPNLKSDNSPTNETKSSGLQSFGSHGSGLLSTSRTSSNSSSLMNSALPSSQSSGLFSFSQKPAVSNSQSSASSTSQNTGPFSISQKPASSSLQSSGSSSSQSSGFFAFGQTPTASSLKDSCASASQSSGLFSFSQTALSSSSQSSGLSCSQSFGLSNISQKLANSSSQNPGLFSAQSSGLFSINQTPVFGGTQAFPASTVEASGDADEGNDAEQPSSPSLKKIEEKGVVVVHEVICKVYIKADNSTGKLWDDRGRGQLSIKCKEGADKATKESKPTIVIRNDVGRILLNALIYSGIKMNINKNSIMTIFHTSADEHGVEDGKGSAVARTYLLKLKTQEETTKLAAAIQDYAPLA